MRLFMKEFSRVSGTWLTANMANSNGNSLFFSSLVYSNK